MVNQTTEYLNRARESPARDELKTEEEKRAHDQKALGTDYRDASGALKTGFPPTDSRGRRLAISGIPGPVSGGEAVDKWLAGLQENIDEGDEPDGEGDEDDDKGVTVTFYDDKKGENKEHKK